MNGYQPHWHSRTIFSALETPRAATAVVLIPFDLSLLARTLTMGCTASCSSPRGSCLDRIRKWYICLLVTATHVCAVVALAVCAAATDR